VSVVYDTTANVASAAIRNFRIGPSLSNRIESRSFAGPYHKRISERFADWHSVHDRTEPNVLLQTTETTVTCAWCDYWLIVIRIYNWKHRKTGRKFAGACALKEWRAISWNCINLRASVRRPRAPTVLLT